MAESYTNTESSGRRGLVSVKGFDIQGASDSNLRQVTIKEIVLAESLLTPGLQTAVTLQSAIYFPGSKNFDDFKNKPITFLLESPTGGTLAVNQQVYRLDKRSMVPTNVGQTEEFTIHACDQTLLNDAMSLVSKSWSCTTPSDIAGYVLRSCAGARVLDIESASPARDYIAENIHPFQVVAQQTNVALANGGDPSFLHYMTYENYGTHHFRSLATLTAAPSIATFNQAETGQGGSGSYSNPNAVIAFSFPCDFDYLSDLLNGLDENGNNMNTLAIFNPVSKSMSMLGNQNSGCGLGGFNYKQALSNKQTKTEQQSCNMDVETHLLKRQARMGLLERDKIALRITVPFNASLHAGKIIKFNWVNKYSNGAPVYGYGDYLISSMSHTIKLGGFSVTTMDCVSRTVGQGVV